MMVSPDGSLRDKSGSNIYYALEGKALSNEIVMKFLQHYGVPVRYVTQTVFESKEINSDKEELKQHISQCDF